MRNTDVQPITETLWCFFERSESLRNRLRRMRRTHARDIIVFRPQRSEFNA
jgi:hypothetical protein